MIPIEHTEAQDLAVQASLLLRGNEAEKAKRLYAKAAELEARAFSQVAKNLVRTRGILAVSIVSLLYKAASYDEAELKIFSLMVDDSIPVDAKSELRLLLESVADERSVLSLGKEYVGEELTLSLRRGSIGYGTAPLSTVLFCANAFQSLVTRIAEFIEKKPLRRSGQPAKEILGMVESRVGQPTAGSYKIQIGLVQPSKQLNLYTTTTNTPALVAKTTMEVMRMIAASDVDQLSRAVPDDGYRATVAKLARNMFPPGRAVGEIEIFSVRRDKQSCVLQSRARLTPEVRYLSLGSTPILGSALATEQNPQVREIRGILRAVHLDKGWIEVAEAAGQHTRIDTKSNEVDDVIGPMVNRTVTAKVHNKPGKPIPVLVDVTLEDEE